MTKKQLMFVSTVAAIPAAGLLVFLILGLLQGMLSDTATVSVTLWIVWVLAALGSLSISFLPFAIMFFPGLMPEPGLVSAGESGVGEAPAAPSRRSSKKDESDEGDEYEEEADGGEDDEAGGESLFDEEPLDDDFDDEFGNFDDEEK